MNFFEAASLRLKQQLAVTQDQELANAFGMSKRAWAGRKSVNNFPEIELYALAKKRPELCLDVDYILTGKTQSMRIMENAVAATAELHALASASQEELPAKLADYEQRGKKRRAARKGEKSLGSVAEFPPLAPDELELLAMFRAAPLAIKAEAIRVLQGASATSRYTMQNISAPVSGDVAGRDVVHHASPPERSRK
ncbi:MAG: helix-turn-helix domain containing protein [Azoarcus sp.]|jgi:hypothetical protein|nr:helix-turn-helix domain containing protein [Azoarcus sp.]